MDLELSEITRRVRLAYGDDGLRVLDGEVLASAGLDEMDVEFLSTVGVPAEEQLNISFNLADSLPLLRDYIKGRFEYAPEWPLQFRCLNEKYGIVLGVNVGGDMSVLCIDLTRELPIHFVNTRIRYFVGFLAECVLHWRRTQFEGVDWRDSWQMLLDWMTNLDAAGANGPWWKGVLHEIELYQGPGDA